MPRKTNAQKLARAITDKLHERGVSMGYNTVYDLVKAAYTEVRGLSGDTEVTKSGSESASSQFYLVESQANQKVVAFLDSNMKFWEWVPVTNQFHGADWITHDFYGPTPELTYSPLTRGEAAQHVLDGVGNRNERFAERFQKEIRDHSYLSTQSLLAGEEVPEPVTFDDLYAKVDALRWVDSDDALETSVTEELIQNTKNKTDVARREKERVTEASMPQQPSTTAELAQAAEEYFARRDTGLTTGAELRSAAINAVRKSGDAGLRADEVRNELFAIGIMQRDVVNAISTVEAMLEETVRAGILWKRDVRYFGELAEALGVNGDVVRFLEQHGRYNNRNAASYSTIANGLARKYSRETVRRMLAKVYEIGAVRVDPDGWYRLPTRKRTGEPGWVSLEGNHMYVGCSIIREEASTRYNDATEEYEAGPLMAWVIVDDEWHRVEARNVKSTSWQ